MDLKSLIELNSAYPLWAKVVFFSCVITILGILVFAKKTHVENSASGAGRESVAANVTASEKSDNRPWIVAESLNLKEPITVRDDYFFMNFALTMRNRGTSTARKVYASVRIATMEVLSANAAWEKVVEDFNRENATRAADAERNQTKTIPFGYVIAPSQTAIEPYGCGGPSKDSDGPNVQQVRGGAFFVFGYLEYLDQNGGKHHTRFCFIPDGDSVRPWDLSTFVPNAGYQDAN